MPHYRLTGPQRLSGKVKTASSKNGTVAIMMAAAGIRGEVTLRNVPEIEEVSRVAEILVSMGVHVDRDKPTRTLRIDASGPISPGEMDLAAAARVRISLLLIGSLAGRMKAFSLPVAGGCTLGTRTVVPHIRALESFGIGITPGEEKFAIRAGSSRIHGADLVMLEASDTGTENAILAAVHAPGITKIKFAARNYMVQELCHFLRAAGADIRGIGTQTLEIHGGKPLGSVEWTLEPDPIDAMFWVAAAAATGSHLTVTDVPLDFMELELRCLEEMGLKTKVRETPSSGAFRLGEVEVFPSELHAFPGKLHSGPYPAVQMDSLPLFAPVCAVARGTTLIHDWTYENRAFFLAELQRLGVSVRVADTHRVYIDGPARLRGAEIMMPSILRMGPSFLIAMMAAHGESLLRNVYPMERGYERIPERLASVGVQVVREE